MRWDNEVASLIPASPDSDIKPWCPLFRTHSDRGSHPQDPPAPTPHPDTRTPHPRVLWASLCPLPLLSPGVSLPLSGGAPSAPRPARPLNTRRHRHHCTAHTTTPRSRTTTTAWRGAVPTLRGRGVGQRGGHGTGGRFPAAAGAPR